MIEVLYEEYAQEDGKNYLKLEQFFFKHVLIDNESGSWEAWFDDPDDTLSEFCTSLVGKHETSEACFKALEALYDEQLKTPRGLKASKLVFFDIQLEKELDKLNLFFKYYFKDDRRKSLNQHLKSCHRYLKSLNVDFDLIISSHQADDDGGGYDDIHMSDLEGISGTICYISDRYNAAFRIRFLKRFQNDFK